MILTASRSDLPNLKILYKRVKFAVQVREKKPLSEPREYKGTPYPLPNDTSLKISTTVSNANFLHLGHGDDYDSKNKACCIDSTKAPPELNPHLWNAYIHALLARGIERHFLTTGERILDNGHITDLLLSIDRYLFCDYTKL